MNKKTTDELAMEVLEEIRSTEAPMIPQELINECYTSIQPFIAAGKESQAKTVLKQLVEAYILEMD